MMQTDLALGWFNSYVRLDYELTWYVKLAVYEITLESDIAQSWFNT